MPAVTHRVPLTQVRNWPPAAVEALLAFGTVEGEHLVYDQADPRYAAALALATVGPYPARDPPRPVQPVPRDRWPFSARTLARLARPGERGLGTVLTRLLGNVGGEVYKRWFVRIVGRPCGCTDMATKLDVMYPLSGVDPEPVNENLAPEVRVPAVHQEQQPGE